MLFQVADLLFHGQFFIFQGSYLVIQHKSEVFQMSVDISEILDGFFLALDDFLSFAQLLLHLDKSGVAVEDFAVELLLLLAQLELDLITVLQLLLHCVFFTCQLFMTLSEIIEVLAKLAHLAREVISPLK
jgi:hypothetical protein